MNAVQKLFAKARKPTAPAAAAPAKRGRSGVRCGELNAAIAAVSDVLDNPCTTRQTLEALYFLTDDTADGDIVKFIDPAPVTLEALDDAIAQAQEPELGLSAGSLTALRRVRALLAREQSARAAEPPQFVTVAQLKAHDTNLFDAFAWALGAMAAELNRGQPNQAHVIDQLNRSASTHERKRLLAAIREFREEDVPRLTQQEWLRYQSYGPGR
jgi:hypothetical protein